MMTISFYTRENPIDADGFDGFFSLLDASLPRDEHRSYAAQKALLDEQTYALLIGRLEGRVVAAMAVWEFVDLRYIEHFAVSSELRGQGIGGDMLRDYLARDTRRVVLEVEPPQTELARRRIGFYRRCGFSLSEFPYEQPPLNPGDSMLPLMLMSSGGQLSDAEAAGVKKTLYREVYHIL